LSPTKRSSALLKWLFSCSRSQIHRISLLRQPSGFLLYHESTEICKPSRPPTNFMSHCQTSPSSTFSTQRSLEPSNGNPTSWSPNKVVEEERRLIQFYYLDVQGNTNTSKSCPLTTAPPRPRDPTDRDPIDAPRIPSLPTPFADFKASPPH